MLLARLAEVRDRLISDPWGLVGLSHAPQRTTRVAPHLTTDNISSALANASPVAARLLQERSEPTLPFPQGDLVAMPPPEGQPERPPVERTRARRQRRETVRRRSLEDEIREEQEMLLVVRCFTGRALPEWMALIGAMGFDQRATDKNDIIDWLRNQGFPFNWASWFERIWRNGGLPLYCSPDVVPGCGVAEPAAEPASEQSTPEPGNRLPPPPGPKCGPVAAAPPVASRAVPAIDSQGGPPAGNRLPRLAIDSAPHAQNDSRPVPVRPSVRQGKPAPIAAHVAAVVESLDRRFLPGAAIDSCEVAATYARVCTARGWAPHKWNVLAKKLRGAMGCGPKGSRKPYRKTRQGDGSVKSQPVWFVPASPPPSKPAAAVMRGKRALGSAPPIKRAA